MRIAVVQHVRAGYYSEYISSLLDEVAVQSNYQVKTWSNSVPVSNQLIAENAIVYILIESTGTFSLKWWYAAKLPSILNKIKAAVVIDLNGISSSAKIPQLVCLDQTISSEKIKTLNTIDKLAVSNFRHSIKRAAHAVTYSENKVEDLIKHESPGNKLKVIRFTAPENFRKFEWHEKIMIKAMQADNNEYFLSVLNDDAEGDFTLLLQGFSKFKKWQQSNMKLLLLPKYEAFEQKIHNKLKTYKYREDVKLIEGLEETQLISIVASAHSLIHVTSVFADLMVLSIALKCALPVITYKNADIEEYLGAAAYYVNDTSEEVFGDALIALYKDENLHAQLKDFAEKQSVFLNREMCKSELWQLLQTAAHYQIITKHQ